MRKHWATMYTVLFLTLMGQLHIAIATETTENIKPALRLPLDKDIVAGINLTPVAREEDHDSRARNKHAGLRATMYILQRCERHMRNEFKEGGPGLNRRRTLLENNLCVNTIYLIDSSVNPEEIPALDHLPRDAAFVTAPTDMRKANWSGKSSWPWNSDHIDNNDQKNNERICLAVEEHIKTNEGWDPSLSSNVIIAGSKKDRTFAEQPHARPERILNDKAPILQLFNGIAMSQAVELAEEELTTELQRAPIIIDPSLIDKHSFESQPSLTNTLLEISDAAFDSHREICDRTEQMKHDAAEACSVYQAIMDKAHQLGRLKATQEHARLKRELANATAKTFYRKRYYDPLQQESR